MRTVSLPSYTIGPDAYDAIPKVAQGLGQRLFVVGGKTAMEKGMPVLEKAVAGSGLQLAGAVWYGGECDRLNIAACAAAAQAAGAQILLGMGGGKALDTAKAAAWQLKLPVFTLPTIASTCAATTALSVVYDEKGAFDSFAFFEAPAHHSFINTQIIAQAPVQYLRAGVGDTIAKYYEATLASRGDQLAHSSALGVTISSMCFVPMWDHARQALQDCAAGRLSFALEQVVLANIVSTGLVSYLVDEDYNGAIAHSLFYGLTLLPHIEKEFLHGDVVGYGILVQLAVDGRQEEGRRLRGFFEKLGIPVSLAQLKTPLDRQLLAPVLAETVAGPDMAHLPYTVSEEMVWQALCQVEKWKSEGPAGPGK